MVEHEPCKSRDDCYHARAGRIGGYNQPLEAKTRGGRTQGYKNIESGQIQSIATSESCVKGGRNQSREAKARGGHIQGRKNAALGQIQHISSIGGHRRFEIYGTPATLEGCSKGGRWAVRSGHLARLSKGIPSIADGILFRSQTEVMLYCVAQELGGEPTYEPYVIYLPDGRSYIPDFILGRSILDIPANVPIELKPIRNAYFNSRAEKAIKAGAVIIYWNELVE